MRSLVVGAATLAILLVCFSIYQVAQQDGITPAPPRPQRIPPTPTSSGSPIAADQPDSGIAIGGGFEIGQGRDITLHLYAREGTRAVMEIAVQTYTPVAGSANEFKLIRPEIRLRTKDGRGVKVTADSGILEAQRSGGSLDPRRGRLDGDVVILIDRFSEEELAKRPELAQDTNAPNRYVRIEAESIEFDLEYSKVVVPGGTFRVTAADLEFVASDLEVRFDQEQDRIEYLRINDGARLELRAGIDQFGIKLPTSGTRPEQRSTIIGWLRQTLQASLAAEQAATARDPLATAAEPVAERDVVDDGVPTFELGEKDTDEETTKPPVRYFVHMEREVNLRQMNGDVVESQLLADVLEIVRAFSEEDKDRARGDGGQEASTEPDTPALAETQVILLTWQGRLTLEACADNEARCDTKTGTQVTAFGQPVRLSSAEAEATCERLVFQPDIDEVELFGSEASPVTVRSADQGTLIGTRIKTRRSGDDLLIEVTGPGRLARMEDPPEVLAGAASDAPERYVAFDRHLTVTGRYVRRTEFSFSQGVTKREYRVLDRALFTGGITMLEDGMRLEADELDVDFSRATARRGGRQAIKHLVARGHVNMTQDADRLRCRELDVVFTQTPGVSIQPLLMTAMTDVEAVQGSRTIKAAEKLVVRFERIERPAAPFNAAKAYAQASAAGLDITEIDWEAKRREQANAVDSAIAVSHLAAFGGVSVIDLEQNLNITADRLESDVANGSDIVEARVWGTDDAPAVVQLDMLSVTGREVLLNIPDQWARVPGAGHMTFLSQRDLDGRHLDEPMPITVQWADQMTFRGKENLATFEGRVHATSSTNTTFDSERLLVEFEDAVATSVSRRPAQDWWIFQDLVDRLSSAGTNGNGMWKQLSKQPSHILATDNVVVLTSETDPTTGKLASRARLAGPRLSLDLRPAVTKLLIEGKGNLQLESFGSASDSADTQAPAKGGLFSLERSDGPSKTLIEWRDSMWYDFSAKQAQFEGDVSLKHFSGSELARIFGTASPSGTSASGGRRTFVSCDTLTASFDQNKSDETTDGTRRLGGMTIDGLSQFRALRNVTIQDKTEGLALSADRVEYLRDRDLLAIHGATGNRADIVIQRRGQFPRKYAVDRCFYHLSTGVVEIKRGSFSSR